MMATRSPLFNAERLQGQRMAADGRRIIVPVAFAIEAELLRAIGGAAGLSACVLGDQAGRGLAAQDLKLK